VAGVDEARDRGEDDAESGGSRPDRLGEKVVVARQVAQCLGEPIALGAFGQHREDAFRRGAVGLGEQHVEGDRGRALIVEPGDEFGEPPPRPRPLAEALERAFVDGDDPDRQGGIVGARVGALELVEDDVAQRDQRRRIGEPHGEPQGDQHQPHRQDRKLPHHPPHAGTPTAPATARRRRRRRPGGRRCR
jgi:hypothetical protein